MRHLKIIAAALALSTAIGTGYGLAACADHRRRSEGI